MIEFGIIPVKEFEPKLIMSRVDKVPIEVGMVPIILFDSMNSTFSEVIKKIEFGIVPVIELNAISIVLKLGKLSMELGSEPFIPRNAKLNLSILP